MSTFEPYVWQLKGKVPKQTIRVHRCVIDESLTCCLTVPLFLYLPEVCRVSGEKRQLFGVYLTPFYFDDKHLSHRTPYHLNVAAFTSIIREKRLRMGAPLYDSYTYSTTFWLYAYYCMTVGYPVRARETHRKTTVHSNKNNRTSFYASLLLPSDHILEWLRKCG